MDIRSGIKLFLKGMAMGAADVVPGVSGGTIAFITGIYEELLGTIRSVGPRALNLLRHQGPAVAWRHINGSFLVVLLAGIATSVLLLVRPITWALEHQPVLIWSFFFGLIAASIWLCGRTVRQWGVGPALGLAVGTAAAVFVGMANAGQGGESLAWFFGCGMLAICAMILPGISGSFILLLLGAYAPVMAAIKAFDIPIIAVFIAGCVAGLLLFSHVLGWMFRRAHDLTVATLTGFLLGSLTIVWPWRHVVSTRVHHPGRPDERIVPFETRPAWPTDFSIVTDNDRLLGIVDKQPMLAGAIALMVLGMVLVLGLERLGSDRRA
jgi:putative membrane protein